MRSPPPERPLATPPNLRWEWSASEIDRLGILLHEFNILSGLEDGAYRSMSSEHRRIRAQLGKPMSSIAELDRPLWTGRVLRLCPISNSFVERNLVVLKTHLLFYNRASGLCTDVIPVPEIRLAQIRLALQNDGTPLHCVSHLIPPGQHFHYDQRHVPHKMGSSQMHMRTAEGAWRDRAVDDHKNERCALALCLSLMRSRSLPFMYVLSLSTFRSCTLALYLSGICWTSRPRKWG